MPRHVRKGDSVVITAGNFRGAQGEIVRVDGDNSRVFVKFPASVYDGIKRKPLVKTLKPSRVNPQGGQVAVDRSFHISNVSPSVDGKPTRVRFPVKKDGSKVRVAVKGGKELSSVRGPRAAKKA
jgi:large subunit ribosomal protein L24